MNIVFITTASFPYGAATSSRTRNLVKLFKYVGHNVHVISDVLNESSKPFDDCTYEAVKYKRGVSIGEQVLESLVNYNKDNRIDIVCMNAKSDRFWIITDYCKKNNIKVVIESCEWYDYTNFKKGKEDDEFKQNEKMIKEGFKIVDGFISISRLLDNHNNSIGRNSVRIPTILDSEEIKCLNTTSNNQYIQLVYTGRPGKSKEILKPIILSIIHNKKIYENIHLDVYGVNFIQLMRNLNYNIFLWKNARKYVKIHGQVDQISIKEIIMKADFQIFVRPNRKSSNAGFPTKLGESMMAGTPVIANDTGDIGLYLKDKHNGYIIDGVTEKDVTSVLIQVLKLNTREKKLMRENARKDAEEYFDYRNYEFEIRKLIANL